MFFPLYGRWEDLDRWKWVLIDVGVILDTPASHSGTRFDILGSCVGTTRPHTIPIPQVPTQPLLPHTTHPAAGKRTTTLKKLPMWELAGSQSLWISSRSASRLRSSARAALSSASGSRAINRSVFEGTSTAKALKSSRVRVRSPAEI